MWRDQRAAKKEAWRMTAKEYLSQAWKIRLRIESMAEILAFLKSATEYTTPALSDMPKSASINTSKNEDAIIRYMEYDARIQVECDKLRSVLTTIANLSDPVAQAILVKRYIENKTWDVISNETSISIRQAHRLHQYALDEIGPNQK